METVCVIWMPTAPLPKLKISCFAQENRLGLSWYESDVYLAVNRAKFEGYKTRDSAD